MAALEARAMHYLFKLRLTKKVKRYIERTFATPEWTDAGQGWQGREGSIQLGGWSRRRGASSSCVARCRAKCCSPMSSN